jgi:integrase
MSVEPFVLIDHLRIESGQRWGDVADAVQKEDARAVLDFASTTPFHWLGRARGWSKTSDLSGIALEVLLRAPPAARLRQTGASLTAMAADEAGAWGLSACRDAGVPRFGPHALRHRRVSLLHRQGVDWATIGAIVGQRSKLVTAETYTHAVIDGREIDRAGLLERARAVTPSVSSRPTENGPLAGAFWAGTAHHVLVT